LTANSHITSYSKERKTLGLRSFVSNFSQALSALYAALGLQSDNEVD